MELGSLHNAAVVYNTEEKKLAVDFGSHSGEDDHKVSSIILANENKPQNKGLWREGRQLKVTAPEFVKASTPQETKHV